jgi:cystathionine beta-lyase
VEFVLMGDGKHRAELARAAPPNVSLPGAAPSKEEVAALAARHDVLVLADEIHAALTLRGAVHTPFGALGDGRWVAFASASKAFNLAGLKCAIAIAGSDAVARELDRLPSEVRYRAGLLGVIASQAAFEHGDAWLDELLAALDANRRRLARLLEEHLPGIGHHPPDASFLAWLDCRPLGLGDDPAAVFLERGRVALEPGPGFGTEGRGFARLNFGTSEELLGEAVRRMAAAVAPPPRP